jgi:uronate dehydrogenase
MMVTYLSYDDLTELIRCSLFAPRVGHTIAYGTSNNAATWYDNSKAAHLGFVPKDSSAPFAHLHPPTSERPAKDDAATIYQGGPFVVAGPFYPME